ncbi:MAG: DnaJ domain-containing protein [Deltaproteobacteria bacterium]|nr:DnaJ domain-containing protein [Deltaproteobacteria bacterium]
MTSWSKAVGAGLGYAVGGPIGAVLGYMAGRKLTTKLKAQEGHLLIANLLGFTTLLLKTTSIPSSEDRKEAVLFLSRLFRFDREDEQLADELLQRLLQVDLDIVAMAKTFKSHSDKKMRQRLLEILATVSLLIHGPLEKVQLSTLDEIAEALNLTPAQWQTIKSQYRGPSPQLDISFCYAILELYPESSEEEIRAAYRRLAKKYHPDRFALRAQPTKERYSKRMTLINGSYETIRVERGLKNRA